MFRQYSVYIVCGIAALLLLMAAMVNGFPLVYSDTSTYLASGFELETPADRPITYGLFIRLTSFNGYSLWGTVFFQSFLLAFLVYKLFKTLNFRHTNIKTISVFIFVSFTTGVSWVSSQLIADIFTPMLILSWALILLNDNSKKWGYYLLLFFLTAMHISHLFMTTGICFILLLVRLNHSFSFHIPVRKLGFMLLSSAIAFPVFASSVSKYSNVFYVAKLDGSGLLKEILEDNCSTTDLKLCLYKDSLPNNTTDFIWKENSPLQKIGGYKEGKEELKKIKYLSFSQARYVKKMAKSSIADSWKQLFCFDIADGNGVFMEGTKLFERIKLYAGSDVTSYSNSRQQKGTLLKPGKFMMWFNATMLLALGTMFWFFVRGRLPKEVYLLILITLSGVVLNACICGSLSEVSNRFQCRVAWLVVFLAAILLMEAKKFKEPKNDLNEKK